MIKKILWLSLAVLVLAPSLATADFVAVGHPNFSSGGEGKIFIFGPEGATGSATSNDGFSENFSIGSSGVAVITVPQSEFLNQDDTVLGNAIFVESDAAISGSFLNRRDTTTDLSFLFDVPSLGTEYRVLSWSQSFGEGLQFSITAIEDATTVTITPTTDLSSGQLAGDPFNVSLDAGESIKYLAPDGSDPSGTEVIANRPVAVFAGAACANVPPNVSACDHLFSQIPSIDNFATEFIVPETANTGGVGNVVRILAGSDDTDVIVNGSPVATLADGQFHEIQTANDLEIQASNPVLVGQYLKGTTGTGEAGDPAFSIIGGLGQLLSTYAFTTPTGADAFNENYVNVAIPTTDLASLTLNGSAVDSSLFDELAGTGYSVGSVAVAAGAGLIEAATPFVASLSGFDSADSYHSILGTNFSPGASPDPEPEPEPQPVIPVPALGLHGLIALILALSFMAAIRLR